jgi:protein-S-isoprenylcysteine O-methyltransferase Ste14
MRIPPLGPRGEGWAVVQLVLAFVIVVAGIAGPGWPETATAWRVGLGVAIGVAGWVLFLTGAVGLGRSLTPFPKPMERATLRVNGVYGLVRHPIYGGSLLVALGWSLLSSPVALIVTAVLASVFELKARLEESMLVSRYPAYQAYRTRVRWRFVPGIR